MVAAIFVGAEECAKIVFVKVHIAIDTVALASVALFARWDRDGRIGLRTEETTRKDMFIFDGRTITAVNAFTHRILLSHTIYCRQNDE